MAKVHGGHVNWVFVGTIELVYWNVWAAFTPLVIALAKRFPLTGPGFVSHIAIHTIASFLMAPLASVTEYFLSRGLLGLLFRITDPGTWFSDLSVWSNRGQSGNSVVRSQVAEKRPFRSLA